jgi:hypothetical protein
MRHLCCRHFCSSQPHLLILLSRSNQASGDQLVTSLNKPLVFWVKARLGATRTMALRSMFQATYNKIITLQLYWDKLTSSRHQLSYNLRSSRYQLKVTLV